MTPGGQSTASPSSPERPSPGRIDLLLVESHPGAVALVQSMLTSSLSLEFDVRVAGSLREAREVLRVRPPEVVVLDLSLPDSSGLSSLVQARELAGEVPIVVMTGLDDERVDERAAELGAHGYLVKGEMTPGILRRQVRHAIEQARVRSALETARQAATELATRDSLTGLANRLVLEDRLQRLLSQARRTGARFGVLMLDLDGFKSLNDVFGHALGDHVLRQVAHRLSRFVRESDTVARFGGDEFVILLANLSREMDAARVAGKVIAALREPMVVEGRSYVTAASIGIATFPSDGDDAKSLLASADAAMYHAKRSGAGQYRFHRDEMTEAATGRLEIERGLRHAVARDELRLHFQPTLDARTGALAGMEALLRWQHPDHGLLSPGSFLPVAQESGAIVEIGAWVLAEICRRLAAWRRDGHDELCVSVNVAERQLASLDFADLVEATLAEHGLPGSALAVEVQEGLLVEENGAAERTARALGDLSVRVEIDDFGSGLSCLRRLRDLPLHALKLDRRFVQGLAAGPRERMLLAGVVSLARGLGAGCVAKGVETPEEWEIVRELDCDRVQGFLFGPPVPGDEVGPVLARSAEGWLACAKPDAGD